MPSRRTHGCNLWKADPVIEWRKIRNRRHIISDGKAICGVFGGYTEDDGVPCEACLNHLARLQDEAFSG